jgi:hypothetical protein
MSDHSPTARPSLMDWLLQPGLLSRVCLILSIACFYAGAVVVNNNLLFFWAHDADYRFWFYPPAGLRLIMIMLLGWPAVLGHGIAATALNASFDLPEVELLGAVFLGFCRSLSVWAGLALYSRATGLRFPWSGITWAHIPAMSVAVSLFSAVTVHFLRAILGVEPLEEFVRNVSLNVLGDTLGTIVVLVALIRLRRAFLRFARTA